LCLLLDDKRAVACWKDTGKKREDLEKRDPGSAILGAENGTKKHVQKEKLTAFCGRKKRFVREKKEGTEVRCPTPTAEKSTAGSPKRKKRNKDPLFLGWLGEKKRRLLPLTRRKNETKGKTAPGQPVRTFHSGKGRKRGKKENIKDCTFPFLPPNNGRTYQDKKKKGSKGCSGEMKRACLDPINERLERSGMTSLSLNQGGKREKRKDARHCVPQGTKN